MVQKIEVFQKGWNFASCSCFASSWKNIFFIEGGKRAFSPYFHNEIIFCCTELFECAFNFKFLQNIFTFLNIDINQTSKEQDLNLIRSSHLFWEHRKVFWNHMSGSKLSGYNFTLRAFLSILVTSFWPVPKHLLKF